MSERLQKYLDGELSYDELTPEERREVAQLESFIHEARRTSDSIAAPDLTLGIMMRVQEEVKGAASHREASALQRISRWLWHPQPVRLRPVYGVLAAAILFGVIWLQPIARHSPENVATPGKVFVQFRIDAPEAAAVRLAGNFTDWKPAYTLRQVQPGTWSVLVPLNPGVYDYAFVVNDTEWVTDPAAPSVADGFGGLNSQVSVLLPGEF